MSPPGNTAVMTGPWPVVVTPEVAAEKCGRSSDRLSAAAANLKASVAAQRDRRSSSRPVVDSSPDSVQHSVLLVDASDDADKVVCAMEQKGYSVEHAGGLLQARVLLSRLHFDVVVCSADFLEVVKDARKVAPSVKVVLRTCGGNAGTARVDAVISRKAGIGALLAAVR